MLGLEKDLRSGWHNLVNVMRQQHGLSLRAAVERVVELHNREAHHFTALEASLRLLLERHASLRSVFVSDEGHPVPRIQPLPSQVLQRMSLWRSADAGDEAAPK